VGGSGVGGSAAAGVGAGVEAVPIAGSDGTAGSGSAGGGGDGPSGCGARGGMRGKSSRTVMVGRTARTFIAYLPPSASATTALPFVYVFHGATQTGAGLYDMTEYAKLADSEGIAVVFPDGQGASSATGVGALNPWNVSNGPPCCGLGTLVSNPNAVDFDFIDAIKADILQDQCLDLDHVFVTGFSMGGYFSHHVACNRPDFRAAAPHSGGTMADLSTCKTTRMPIVIFHGNADLLIAAGCSDPNSPEQLGSSGSSSRSTPGSTRAHFTNSAS
jgi:polyhydroxybutyrate depolymerase